MFQHQDQHHVQQRITRIPTESPLTEEAFDKNEQTLNQLELQMYDESLRQQVRAKQDTLIHGAYAGVGFLSVGLLFYFCHAKLMAMFLIMVRGIRIRKHSRQRVVQENDSNTNPTNLN